MTEEFTHALCALIRRLGLEAKQLRDKGLTVEQKGRQDFVSQADVYVETQLRRGLASYIAGQRCTNTRELCIPTR